MCFPRALLVYHGQLHLPEPGLVYLACLDRALDDLSGDASQLRLAAILATGASSRALGVDEEVAAAFRAGARLGAAVHRMAELKPHAHATDSSGSGTRGI